MPNRTNVINNSSLTSSSFATVKYCVTAGAEAVRKPGYMDYIRSALGDTLPRKIMDSFHTIVAIRRACAESFGKKPVSQRLTMQPLRQLTMTPQKLDRCILESFISCL